MEAKALKWGLVKLGGSPTTTKHVRVGFGHSAKTRVP
jgi:hypothetical protein